ncbi:M4 family metallopeptidase [Aquimarina sp. W85]|uniref:M4 family metallopeptidase n=1 Tax=Aquimarina rhodophyticola TaxID=3342246 RepID=UPI00366FEE58
MKIKYVKVLQALAIGFSFFYIKAQSQKREDAFVQPSKFIKVDTLTTLQKNPQELFNQYLGLNRANSYVKISEQVDNIGVVHKRFQQYYNGIRVEYGIAILDEKESKVTALHGEYYNVEHISTKPTITKPHAFQIAINHIGAQQYLWEDVEASKAMNTYNTGGELVILPDFTPDIEREKLHKYNLAYKFDIYAKKPLSRGYVYIDAHTGKFLYYEAIIKHLGKHRNSNKKLTIINLSGCANFEVETSIPGSAATRYSGNRTITTKLIDGSYILRDETRGGGISTYNSKRSNNYTPINFTDNDNIWTANEFNNSEKDNAALDAHWGAEKTYDYWWSVHSRNSYDDVGAEIKSWVHYGVAYDNAFWNGSVMTYGDGSSNGSEGNGTFDALTSIDVAAHEIGHAITSSTANLAYRKESGALNEGFSDIWGAAVEHFAKGNEDDSSPTASVWLIGEDIDRRSGSIALRSMSDPNTTNQPDTYGGRYWKDPNCVPVQSNDYCGVHINSGVLNYWFYLSTIGGTGINDIGSSYNVSGIGILKAAKIAYRTLHVYLSANSNFIDARISSIQATRDLYGENSAEEIAITNAWYAVGVGSEYGAEGGIAYCNSQGENTTGEYISHVQLGAINNISVGSNNGYTDYTTIATDLSFNTSYTITITPTWTVTSYNEGYAVWIDYNQDRDFNDSGELVWSAPASKTTPVKGSFTIPTWASFGPTRMRVSMKYNGIPIACETFEYGEVEDYTVRIENLDAGPIVNGVAIDKNNMILSISPNPVANGEVTINIKNMQDATYQIRNLFGKIVQNGQIKETIDVQDLSAGMYILQIHTATEIFTKRFVKK